MTEEESLQGSWFSTSDMKLAVSLLAAGFSLKTNGECTRLKKDERESFTWHYNTVNAVGQEIVEFLIAWEKPIEETNQAVDPMTSFLVSRETLVARTWLVNESNKVPTQSFRESKGNRVLYTPRLRREDRQRLAQLAS
jgi:hypothetical protein